MSDLTKIRKMLDEASTTLLTELENEEIPRWICYLLECIEANGKFLDISGDFHREFPGILAKTIDALRERLDRGTW